MTGTRALDRERARDASHTASPAHPRTVAKVLPCAGCRDGPDGRSRPLAHTLRRGSWRMKLGITLARTGGLLALSLIGAPAVVVAQTPIDPRCPGVALADRAAQDACQKAVDIFAFMTPQLGVGLVGGNAILGTGGALGGIGRFSIGVRGNGLRGRVPQVGNVNASITGAVRSDYAVDNQVVGLPAVEGALGLFGGIPLGVTHAFALDALLSATYVPEFSRSNVAVSLPDGSLKLGFGGRLGVLTESFATPSVSLTYLRRDLPT